MITQTYGRLNQLPVLLLAAVLALVSGCTSVPEASPEMRQQSLSFAPPSGMAGLYVIRKHHMGGAAALWMVRLDYQVFGSLNINSYLYSAVLPGKHFLRKGPQGDYGMATFVAEAGKNYYFLMGVGIGGPRLDPMPEAEAQEYIRKYKMSGASTYKAPFSSLASGFCHASCVACLKQ
ncbi:MAG: hypothetical protein ACLQU4_22310 [Limisphaerales bacterium]